MPPADKGGHWVALAYMLAFNEATDEDEFIPPNIVTCHLLGGGTKAAVAVFQTRLAGAAANEGGDTP